MMFCFFTKVCSIGLIALASVGAASLTYGQQITVVPLSANSANANYAVSPNEDGVTFVGDDENENDFLIVIDGDIAGASKLTVGPNGAALAPGQSATYSLASPIIKLRDDEYSISLVALPTSIKGTAAESLATNQWTQSNSAWAAARFGWGWQDSLGEWLAANVLIPVVGVENLAGASDTVLVVGTVGTVTAVVVTGFVAVEVGLGVGTLGGGAAAGGGTAAGGEAAATAAYIRALERAAHTRGIPPYNGPIPPSTPGF